MIRISSAKIWVCPLLLCVCLRAESAAPAAFVRVNQVGYATGAPKRALLMSNVPETGATFHVVDSGSTTIYSAPIGPRLKKWNRTYAYVYPLDFSPVTAVGTYTVNVTGPLPAASPAFRIDTGANLYTNLLSNARFFYQAQRDGPNVNSAVMNRQPSHLADASAFIYNTPNFNSDGVLVGGLTQIGGPIDVSGGWLDAGDYLKFVVTTSYTNAIQLTAVRDFPALFTGGSADFATEARFGLDWLQKMWDDSSATLYYQVGIGDGNRSILGDHDQWRLPEADDLLATQPGDPDYFVKYRPVFRAGPSGSQLSPNLAGRLAADFALCFQVYHASSPSYANQCLLAAEHVFDLAKTTGVVTLLTAAPHDFYPEDEWRDDMEWGATELYLATALGGLPSGLPHTDPNYYLQLAAHWSLAYITGPFDGSDSLNLYDVSGLAHYELYHAITQAGDPAGLEITKAELLNDLNDQLAGASARALKDPFGFGFPYADGDAAPHALGLALEAQMYDELAGGTAYQAFAQHQIDWLLGVNAWGSSFVVGAGTTFPHCMQHQIANLAGSLDGSPPIVLGATVDGPSSKSNFSGLGVPDTARPCPADGSDVFKQFKGKKVRYKDDVAAWPSVEPTLDYTALTLLVFARQTALP